MKWTEAVDRMTDGTAVAAVHEEAQLIAILPDTGLIIYQYDDWSVRNYFIPMEEWMILT